MTDIAKIYAKGFHNDFRFYYTHWLPNAEISIGVVGELVNKYFFRPISTLSDLGIPFDKIADVIPDDSPSPMKFTSSRGVEVSTKLEGEVNPKLPNVPQGSAGVAVSFSAQGAFLMAAEKSFEPRMRDILKLEAEILKLYKAGKWDWHYAVIYSIVTAPYADLFVSESTSSGVEIAVTAQGGSIGSVELGKAAVNLTTRSTKGKVLEMKACTNVAPAFQLVGLKRRFLRDPKVGPMAMAGVDLADTIDVPRASGISVAEFSPYLGMLGGEPDEFEGLAT